MPYSRPRTRPAEEETLIDAFVRSCVEFKSSVSYHSASEASSLAPPSNQKQTVLLIGRAAQLRDASAVAAFFPFGAEAAVSSVADASEGSIYLVQALPNVRVYIGVIPEKASRHNSPHRPDVITNVINQALREVKDSASGGVLDVYSLITSEIAVATAAARAATNQFSTKNGRVFAESADKGKTIRVVLASTIANVNALVTLTKYTQLCRYLVDAPTNLLDTSIYTEIAAKLIANLKSAGVAVGMQLIAGDDLRNQGYGGIYSVGKAAEFPPHLVTVTYDGPNPTERIAFVGKGIVYDSGGLSIKSGVGMRGMKHDMGGSAGVLCSFLALAELNAPVTLSTVLCLAENSVGPKSFRNDDILFLKSGKTVEVNNTDAEGRLVLSDGVAHASSMLAYTPDIIIDMATLTGAQGIATGSHHAAIYVNDDAFERRLMDAGRVSGDLVFPVVYCPEFHNSEFSSKVADYTNSVSNRSNAQVSCAAQFVGNNLASSYKGVWAHVDMAYPAAADGRGRGYGVPLLVETFAASLFASN